MSKIPYVKSLIEMATTVEEADAALEKHMGYSNYGVKLAFITAMFNLVVAAKSGDDGISDETRSHNDYFSLLTVIIDRKWR